MGMNLVQKIISAHLVEGTVAAGEPIAIKIDQTLTQDATGTMAYLQFEAMGIDRVRTEKSVSYVDHNMLQTGFENADDHLYLQTVAARYGIDYSRPGNGICHQVHLERYGVPGKTLLGSDSHTPTNGGLGMLAIGAGGLDVAVAMAGGPFHLTMPKVVRVHLTGKLGPWVAAKDIILDILRQLTVKGGVGKILEYTGDGVKTLSVPERATITNMGAELGATTSIFPSDDNTRRYLALQKRESEYRAVAADPDATYDEQITIDLTALEPLIAQPHSPDKVVRVRDVAGLKVDQVCVGSCTNSSLYDLLVTAAILKGRHVHPDVSMTVTPGSRQVFTAVSQLGALTEMISAGARILESACGPCIGMGQAPPSGGVSIRSFNRNFEGRSGTKDANVYLASPQVCAVCALSGTITDPRTWGEEPTVTLPEAIPIDDALIVHAPAQREAITVRRGPNIKPLPQQTPLTGRIAGEVLLKVGDNITTDHIMPAGAKVLPLRSNIPAISEFVFVRVDPEFPQRARAKGGGFIVGGDNYGQGSSREHAALAPMFLGVRAVIAKSFARIHHANLVNFGIPPLTFVDPADYDRIEQGDNLEIDAVPDRIRSGDRLLVRNKSKNSEFWVTYDLSAFNKAVLLDGGLLNHTRRHAA
ncbi:MAG: aconitate hydratase [candidate division Zixibacteria bacterium]|nr:aconitate hydratase [candidate division Zixibacteria bacterium]